MLTATNLYWDPSQATTISAITGGSGVWNTGTAEWLNPTTGQVVAWTGGDSNGPFNAVFSAGSGTITLGSKAGPLFSGISLAAANYTLTNAFPVVLNPGTTIDVAAGGSLTISAVLSSSGQLIKSGSGSLTLTGSNTYTGGTNITGGTVVVTAAGALGSGTVTVSNTGNLENENGAVVTNTVSVIAAAPGGGGVPTLECNGGGSFVAPVSISNPYNISGAVVALQEDSGYFSFLDGQSITSSVPMTLYLQGSGTNGAVASVSSSQIQVVKNGSGTWNVGGTWAGGTIINGGTLSTATPGSGSVTMAGGTTLLINSSVATSDPVYLGTGTETISGGNLTGLVSGPGNLVIKGTGLKLTGSNTYTGSTTVQSGTLTANNSTGSATGTGSVTVDSGAILKGSGSIAGTIYVNSGGILAPGITGISSFGSSGLTLYNGSNFNVVINSSTPGTGFDQLNVSGPINITGSYLNLSGTRTNHDGDQLILINNEESSPIVGTFHNLPEGSYFSVNGVVYVLSYHGGPNGNDVVLTDTTPPHAANDNYNAVENVTLNQNSSQGVLSNDTSYTGATLSVYSVDGSTAAVNSTVNSTLGSLTIYSDGSFTYVPKPNLVGVDDATFYIATDGIESSNSATVQFVISPGTLTATASPFTAIAGQSTGTITLAHFTDQSNVGTYTASISWGDGQTTGGTVSSDGSGGWNVTASHTFATAGSSVVTITIGTNQGASTSVQAMATIAAAEAPPVAAPDSYNLSENVPLVVPADQGVLANDYDLDPTKTVSAVLVSEPSHGTVSFNPDGSFTYTSADNFIGTDSFQYAASDGTQQSPPTTVTFTVDEQDAIASGRLFTVRHDSSLHASVLLAGSQTQSAGVVVLNQNASNGSVTLSSNGTFTYQPDVAFAGQDSFICTIQNGSNLPVTVTVSIDVTDATPVSGDAEFSGYAGQNISGSVLSSAFSPDGGSLSAVLVSGPSNEASFDLNANGSFIYTPIAGFTGTTSFTYQVSDGVSTSEASTVSLVVQNNTPIAVGGFFTGPAGVAIAGNLITGDWEADSTQGMTANVQTLPTNGQLVLNPDGAFIYMPAPGFVGEDSFTYVDSSSGGTSDPATVTLEVTDSIPPAEGESFTDTENQPVTESLATGNPDVTAGSVEYSIAIQPLHGAVTVNPTTGNFTYAPTSGYSGSDVFTYNMSDGQVTTNAQVSVSIRGSVVNTSDQSYTVDNGIVFSGNVLASAYGSSSAGLTISNWTQPQYGTLTMQPDGSFSYSGTGTGSYTDSFQFTATDGTTTDSSTVTMNVVYVAPPVSSAALSTEENTPVIFDTAAISGVSSGITSIAFTNPQNGTVTAYGATVVGSNGYYEYTPATGWSGTDKFTYTVNFIDGSSADSDVSVSVVADPGYAPLSDQSVDCTQGSSTTIRLPGLSNFSQGHYGSVNYTDGMLVYLPDTGYSSQFYQGAFVPDTFVVSKILDNGTTSTATISVTVYPSNQAPGLNTVTLTTSENSSNSISLPQYFTDPNSPDGTFSNPALIVVSQQPAHGSAYVDSKGNLIYTPVAGFSGDDSIQVQGYNNGLVEGNPATVNVTVSSVDAAPIMLGRYNLEIDLPRMNGATGSVNVLNDFYDPDGDALTLSVLGTVVGGTASVSGGSINYVLNDAGNYSASLLCQVSDGIKTGQFYVEINATTPPTAGTPSPEVLSQIVTNGNSAAWYDGEGNTTSVLVSGAPVTVSIDASGVTLAYSGSQSSVVVSSNAATFPSVSVSGATTSDALTLTGNNLPGITFAGTLTMQANGAILGAVSAYNTSVTVNSTSLPGTARGSIHADNNILGVVADTVDGSITAGGAITGNIQAYQISGDITAATGLIQSINVLAHLGGNISAGGDILGVYLGSPSSVVNDYDGDISAGGRIVVVQASGSLSSDLAGASVGAVTVGDSSQGALAYGNFNFSGSIVASAGNIDSLSVPGNLKGSVRATGNIGTLSVGLAETATISAGGSITSIGSFDYAGPTVVDSNINAGSSIYAISSSGNIEGSITAGGQIGFVSPPVGATTPADTGLIAGFDITATVHAGPIITYQAGRDATGTVTTKGNVGGISVGWDFDVSSWSTNPGSGIYSAETGAVGAITIGRDAIGAISAAGGFASINIGRSDDVSLTSSAGGLESLTVGGSDGLTEFSDGSVTKSISTLSDIGNVSIYIAPGQSPTPSAFNITVNSPTASLGNFTDDGSYNGYIDVGLNIGTVRIGSTIGGDLAGSIKAEHGYIGQIIVHQGNLTSALTAAANLGYTPFAGYSIEADGNVTGAINADGDIAPVISNTGNVDSTIISSAGGIAGVQAYLGSIDGNNITAYNSIGDITAGKEISAPITAINGSIGDVSAGTVSAQGSVAFLIPQADDSRVSVDGNSFVVNRLGDLTNSVATDSITGAINANTSIGAITALGEISGDVTGGSSIQMIWAAGNISGNLTDEASVNADSWGDVSGNINAPSGITVAAYGTVSGSLDSTSGGAAVTSWLDITSNEINDDGNTSLWAARDITGENLDTNEFDPSSAGSVNVVAWSSLEDSINTNRDLDIIAGSIANSTLQAQSGNVSVAAPGGLTNVTIGPSAVITPGPTPLTGQLLPGGQTIVISAGNVTGNVSSGTSGLQIFCANFQGNATSYGTISINAKNDVAAGTNVTSNVGQNGTQGAISIDAENVTGNFNGSSVLINAFGAVSGSVLAKTSAEVDADGAVTAQITVTAGQASVTATGSVNAIIDTTTNISVTSLDTVAGTFNSTNGSVNVDAAKAVTATSIGATGVQVIGWSDVGGTETSGAGDIMIFAAGNVTGTISAGNNVGIQALGDITNSAEISSGVNASSSLRSLYGITLYTFGQEAGTVHGSGSISVTSIGNVIGTVTSDTGEIDISTNGAESATISAVTQVLVFADSVGQSVINVSTGGVGITTLHDVTATINAATSTAIVAGGSINTTDTLNAVGSFLSANALQDVVIDATNTPGAVVSVFAGGNATLNAGTASAQTSSIAVSAFGNIQGALFATTNISVSAWGTISELTATTYATVGNIALFSKGTLDANVTAGDMLHVSSLAAVSGTFLANATYAYDGTAEVDSLAGINATIKALNDASVTAVGNIAGEIDSAGSIEASAGGGISAPVTATFGRARAWAIGGAITGTVTAGTDADVFSGIAVSADVTAGGTAYVHSLGTVSHNVRGILDAVVSADGAVSASVTAGRDATVYAESVASNVSAGRTIVVVSGKDVSGSVSAGANPTLYNGGDAIVQALGDVTANVSAYGNAEVDADGDISGSVTATHFAANVQAGGDVTGLVNAGTSATVTALGDITQNIVAQTGATVLALGSVTGDVTAGANGPASVTAGGDVDSDVTSGQDITISSMGDVSGSAVAGGTVLITAAGDESDDVTAGTPGNWYSVPAADLLAAGNLSGTVTTLSGDVVAVADGNESAAVTSAGSATVESFGSLGGSVDAADYVTAESAAAGTIRITAGQSATVTGAADLTVSGSAGQDGTGLGFEIDAVGNATTHVTAMGQVNVSSGGNLSGSAESTAADVNGTAGGTVNFNATSDVGNATVASLGSLAGEVTAPLGIASGSTFGQAEGVTITGGQEADLNALAGGDATVDSTAGDVNVFSGGDLTLTSEAYTNLLAGSNGALNLTQGIADTGWVEAVSVGDLNGTLTSKLSSVTALSVETAFITVNAGTDAVVFGGTEVIGTVDSGNDTEVASYGELALGVVASHDLWVFAAGDVSGIYYAGNCIQSFSSDGSINATLTAGSGINGGTSDYGTIAGVSAWGNIAGSITAAVSVGGVTAGGAVSAHISVPAGQTTSISQGDSGLIGTLPVLGDIGQVELAADVRGLIAQGQQLKAQLIEQDGYIEQQLSADEDEAGQEYQAAVTEFGEAKAMTLQALDDADAQMNATLGQAAEDDQFALGKAQTQITRLTQQVQTQANAAQASDNQSLLLANASITVAEQKLQLIHSIATQIKSGVGQAMATFVAHVNKSFAGAKAQHEIDWQTAFDKTMAALKKQRYDTSALGRVTNGVIGAWNVIVGFAEGDLQGNLNLLVVAGNTVIGSENFSIWMMTGGQSSLFGWSLKIPELPTARGLITTEPDWEYNDSHGFAVAGIFLVSFGLPTGGGAAEAEGAATKLEQFLADGVSKWKNTIKLGDDPVVDAYFKTLYANFIADGGVIVRGVKGLEGAGLYTNDGNLARIYLSADAKLATELEELIHHMQTMGELSRGRTIAEINAALKGIHYTQNPFELQAWEILRSLGFRFTFE